MKCWPGGGKGGTVRGVGELHWMGCGRCGMVWCMARIVETAMSRPRAPRRCTPSHVLACPHPPKFVKCTSSSMHREKATIVHAAAATAPTVSPAAMLAGPYRPLPPLSSRSSPASLPLLLLPRPQRRDDPIGLRLLTRCREMRVVRPGRTNVGTCTYGD